LPQDTAPLNEDTFHEIQLSGKQLVFLFMATTVVSVFIFLCGVLVGRGVRAERAVDAPEASVTPSVGNTAPAAAATTPSTAVGAGPATAEPPPAAESDELSYHKRLQADTAPKEELKPQPEPQRPKVDAMPAATPPAAAPASAAQKDTWVVQLIVLRNRDEASAIVQRLKTKGYPAFVVEPAASAAVRAFKVQVGRYSDRREAEQAARRLEKEEQFKPWILR
jgi:hypothetical protein